MLQRHSNLGVKIRFPELDVLALSWWTPLGSSSADNPFHLLSASFHVPPCSLYSQQSQHALHRSTARASAYEVALHAILPAQQAVASALVCFSSCRLFPWSLSSASCLLRNDPEALAATDFVYRSARACAFEPNALSYSPAARHARRCAVQCLCDGSRSTSSVSLLPAALVRCSRS